MTERLELCRWGFIPGDRYGSRIPQLEVVDTLHSLSTVYIFVLFLFLIPPPKKKERKKASIISKQFSAHWKVAA